MTRNLDEKWSYRITKGTLPLAKSNQISPSPFTLKLTTIVRKEGSR